MYKNSSIILLNINENVYFISVYNSAKYYTLNILSMLGRSAKGIASLLTKKLLYRAASKSKRDLYGI